MEPEQPPSESSDEQMSPSATTTVKEQQRSYECNFCKRGFTNAQALGGHMNIHRKNKPKFKHSSSSSSTAAPPNAVAESPSPTRPRLSPTTAVANPFSISHQGNLFSVPAQADENKSLIPPFHHHDTEIPRNIEQPGNYPSSPEREVDLELRLGHVEPQPESSSENKTTTTRKFF